MKHECSQEQIQVSFSSIERADGTDVLQLGSTAISGEGNMIDTVNSIPLDLDHAEAIHYIRFSDEIISALAEHGDIVGEPNPRRELLERMGMGDAMQGRRNSVTDSVQRLHELGIIQTKKAMSQGENGNKHEIFTPLDKSDNWIKLRGYMFEGYNSWRKGQGLEPIPLIEEAEHATD